MKRWQTLAVGFAISGLFLFLAFRQADFEAISQAFRTARYEYVAASFAAILVTVLLRGLRWSILTQGRLTIIDAFWLFNIGFLFNNVLPARLGEFARAGLAGRRPRMHFTSALSSIVVERLFDMVSVVVLFILVLLVLPLPGWATTAGGAMGAAALVGIVVLALAARRPEWALDLGARLFGMLPRVEAETARRFLEPFVNGLGGVSDARTFALGLGASVLAWLTSGFSAWLLMLAFWERAPLIAGQLSVAAAGLGIAIPAAPSGVGPFEAAVIGVLTATGYDANIARSFAFALHALNFVVTSVLGLLGLMREGVSFGEVARSAESLRAGAGDAGADAQP